MKTRMAMRLSDSMALHSQVSYRDPLIASTTPNGLYNPPKWFPALKQKWS
jgi:hypothetical protein